MRASKRSLVEWGKQVAREEAITIVRREFARDLEPWEWATRREQLRDVIIARIQDGFSLEPGAVNEVRSYTATDVALDRKQITLREAYERVSQHAAALATELLDLKSNLAKEA